MVINDFSNVLTLVIWSVVSLSLW